MRVARVAFPATSYPAAIFIAASRGMLVTTCTAAISVGKLTTPASGCNSPRTCCIARARPRRLTRVPGGSPTSDA